MKKKISLLLFLFSIISSYSQIGDFIDGVVITKELDTLNLKLQFLNETESISYVKYLNEKGKIKKISSSKIKSYSRGNEVYKSLKLTKYTQVLCKQIIKGRNLSLYRQGYDLNNFKNAFPISTPFSPSKKEYFYLENKYGVILPVPKTKRSFRKKVSDFLIEHTLISGKIRGGELYNLREITNLVNDINKN